MGANAGRSGRRWTRIKAQIRATETHCFRCGQRIDWSIPYWTDETQSSVNMDAGTAEHIQDWAKHAHLREDPGNIAASHFKCNLAARNGEGPELGAIPQDLTGGGS